MTPVDRDFELELVGRLRDADPTAVDDVHAEFNARLFGFIARLARNRDVAEELLEETWLRFIANAARLQPDTRLGPWLFTVARNLYVSYCRSRFLEAEYVGDLMSFWPSGQPVASPFEETAANETERRIEAAISSLPATYREVLLLVGVEGLQPIEAAAICGVSADTLRQRLRRARVMLSQRLERASTPDLIRTSEAIS